MTDMRDSFFDYICETAIDDDLIEEAEHEGRKVTLNKPMRSSEVEGKKFKVYVKNEQGNVVVVRFGDANMEIRRDNPEARRSFRARHGCDNPGPKTGAKYWSCQMWSNKNVSDLT